MKNYLRDGDRVVVTAPEAADSGEFLVVGAFRGVAEAAADSGAELVLLRTGVFELPKATGAAWTQGDRLYWDASAKKFTKTAGTNQPVGVAFAAAGTNDTTGEVFISPDAGGFKMAAGQHTTIDADDTVVTGLGTVTSVVASMDDDPVDGVMHVTATIGDQAGAPAAGSIQIKSWKSTDADATLIAGTTFGKKVNWVAFGI